MLFKTVSASVYGIDAYLVEVEVDVGSARMTDFNVVGLPDNAVKESRERIKSALLNSGFGYPNKAVTINLAPANVRKEVRSRKLRVTPDQWQECMTEELIDLHRAGRTDEARAKLVAALEGKAAAS